MFRDSSCDRKIQPETLFLALGWIALGAVVIIGLSWVTDLPALQRIAGSIAPPLPIAGTVISMVGLFLAGLVLVRRRTPNRHLEVTFVVPVAVLVAGISAAWLGKESVFSRLAYANDPASVTSVSLSVAVGGLIAAVALAGCALFLRSMRSAQRAAVDEEAKRRQFETRLASSEAQLRLALESTSAVLFEWDLSRNELRYSPGLQSMLGYAPSDIGPRPEDWNALIHPHDLHAYTLAVGRQIAGHENVIEPEYRVRTAGGSWCWLRTRARIEPRDSGRRPLRIVGTMQDVTAHRTAEADLRTSQAATRKLSLVASRTDNLVLICSPDGTIEWVNDSFSRVMEYPLAEVVGRNPASFMIGPETSARTVRRIRSAMARSEGHSCDVVNYSKSGRKYHLHLEIQPVRSETGNVETFIAILADVTARVEIEQALRRAKSEADTASRAKSEFLASMSHEIRTPMNGVIGMTSLLLDTGLTQQQRDHVNTIRSSSEHLLGIINDILDFSKIESGRMELDHLPFELSASVEDTLELLADDALSKHLELSYVIENGVPPWISGDISRLRQVLVNLVNNAVKFTPGGCIDVTVRQHPAPALPAGRILLEFTVQDTGIGIEREQFGRLFQPFSQVDSSHTRKYGGTGLGLAICHRLCALMGGSFRVESALGRGSRFIFTVETEAVRAPVGTGLPPTPEPLRGRSVLCVDDNPATVRRLELLFQRWGVRFVAATTAAQALTLFESDLDPAIALVDVEMLSGETGASLGARLATQPLPVLMLLPSGYASAQTPFPFGRLTSVGKPLRTLSFIRSLQSLLQIPPDPPLAEYEASTARSLAEEIPLSVLLVEDNPVNQKVALRFLEQLGYRADAVANGLEALASVSSRDYQLVLMDLQMPEMDGFEASRQIRQMLPADRQPRIIALTANALQGDRQLCFAAGMDDYITKPIKSHDLAGAIRRQFGVHESHLPA